MALKIFIVFLMCVVILMSQLVQVAIFSSDSWIPFFQFCAVMHFTGETTIHRLSFM